MGADCFVWIEAFDEKFMGLLSSDGTMIRSEKFMDLLSSD